jgi:hypothetical protein
LSLADNVAGDSRRSPVPLGSRSRGISFDALALGITFGVAGPILGAYLLDLAGYRLTAVAIVAAIVLEALVGLAVFWRLRYTIESDDPWRAIGAAIVAIVALGIVLFGNSPSYVPLSGSVDAVHHYVLIDFIDRHASLPHDQTEAANLGEMTGYPVAACLFVAILGRLTRIPTFFLMGPTCALLLAILAVFVYGAATELMPKSRYYRLAAIVAFPALAWPVQYTFGEFWRDFYLTQMIGVLSLVGAWFWQIRYLKQKNRALLLPIVGMGTVLTLSYPTLLPILGSALVVSAILQKDCRSWTRWIVDATLVGVPLLAFTWIAVHDRVDVGLAILRNNGATISPGFGTLPFAFLALAGVGLLYASARPELRFATVAFWLTGLQTVGYYVAVFGFNELSPYAAKKMFYVLVPMLAVFVTVACVSAPVLLGRKVRTGAIPIVVPAAVLVGASVLYAAGSNWTAEYGGLDPRPSMNLPLTPDQYAAARWFAANLGSAPVVIFADRWITGYWQDVGMLKHSRYPAEPFAPLDVNAQTYDQWLTSTKAPMYAVLSSGFDDLVGDEADTLFRSGDSAIIRKHPDSKPMRTSDIIGQDLILRGFKVIGDTHSPGETLQLSVDIKLRATAAHRDWIQARIYDQRGQVVATGQQSTVPLDQLKPNPWNKDVNLAIPVGVALAASTPAGAYDVKLSFFTEFWQTLPISLPSGEQTSSISMGAVTIAPAGVLSVDNKPERPIGATLGDRIELVGIDAPRVASDGLVVNLYWNERAPVDVNYTVFVQLLNSAGALAAQTDSFPLNGAYPTSVWTPGQTIRDAYSLKWQPGALSGHYRLIAGMYRVDTMTRLSVQGPLDLSKGDYVILEDVDLSGEATQ